MSLGFRDWRAAREVRLMEKAGTRPQSDRTPPRGGAGAGHSASLTAVDPAPAPGRDLGVESWEPAPSPPRGAEGRIGRSSDTIGHAGLEKAPAGGTCAVVTWEVWAGSGHASAGPQCTARRGDAALRRSDSCPRKEGPECRFLLVSGHLPDSLI